MVRLEFKRRILWLALAVLALAGCRSAPVELSIYSRPANPVPGRERLLEATPPSTSAWSPAEVDMLKSLWLGSLPSVPPDPSSAVADDPRAAALGHRLFFDARLSANNQISCATCHRPDLVFTDGRPQALGTQPHRRNTMPLIGPAYSTWLLWDGRKDSLWAQAIDPIESPDEQGSTRLHALHLIGRDESYRAAYEEIFGPLPDLSDFNRFPDSGGPVDYSPYRANWERMDPADQAAVTQVLVNVGKAIAAYERLILPGPSRFDAYVQAILEGDLETMKTALTADEIAGLRLFIGPADCVRCHHGPLFTDNRFHNTGVPQAEGPPPDEGRAAGLSRVLADEFNCLSQYSDAAEPDCLARRQAETETGRVYAFKSPTLRNIAQTGPYMHAGQLATLRVVLDHYNQAPPAPLGQSELAPLGLTGTELAHLEAFLRSLSAPPASPPELLAPPE
jgi:cytochrome c peroxidase